MNPPARPEPAASPLAASPPASRAARSSVGALYLLTFLSGVAALVYQIAWARMLSLTFGGTTFAAATVVASFMGGMGLGAWLYHRIYDRLPRPLLIFASLELGIAVSTAALTATFYSLPEVFADLSRSVGSGWTLGVIRLVCVFSLLVIPATLMGATFPALCTVMIQSVKAVDRHLGRIYGINTIGAAGGALLSGFVLIERFGLRHSVLGANCLNVLVGLCALLLLRSGLGSRTSQPPAEQDTAIPTFLSSRLTALVLLISGFTTLSYEMYWIRAFRYVMGNSTYALTTTIMMFLIGLGFGSLLLERILKRGAAERSLSLIQLGIAILSLAGMAGVALLLWSDSLRGTLSVYSKAGRFRPWEARIAIQMGVACVTLLPATMLMGLTIPLATRLFLGDVRKLGNRIGLACFVSNLGSIVGAMIGAAFLLPLLGTIGGTKLSALLNLCLAALLAHRCRGQVKILTRPVVAVGAVALAAVIFLPATPHFLGEVEELGVRHSQLIHQEEGDLGTVQVLQVPDEPEKLGMTLDGATIGLGEGFRGAKLWHKQTALVHLPMVLDTRIRKTLNVGLGSGSTLWTLAKYAQVEQMDCVEINPAVVRGWELFDEYEVLQDPRVNLVVDDAIHFLLCSDERYDLIISDGKQDPLHSANAALLCHEFYEYSLDRLSDDGLFVQWLPLGTLHSDLLINLRTLAGVFPEVSVFFFPPDNILVVASREPLSGRPLLAREDFTGFLRDDLELFGMDNLDSVLGRWVAGKRRIQLVLGDGPVSRWDHIRLDFSPFKASSEMWSTSSHENLATIVAAQDVTPAGGYDTLVAPDDPYRRSANMTRRALMEYYRGRLDLAVFHGEQATELNPDDITAFGTLGFLQSQIRKHGSGSR